MDYEHVITKKESPYCIFTSTVKTYWSSKYEVESFLGLRYITFSTHQHNPLTNCSNNKSKSIISVLTLYNTAREIFVLSSRTQIHKKEKRKKRQKQLGKITTQATSICHSNKLPHIPWVFTPLVFPISCASASRHAERVCERICALRIKFHNFKWIIPSNKH